MSRQKIGRNDPCPCGSGKKYKNCCIGQDFIFPQAEIEQLRQEYKETRSQAAFKECLHPDHSCCSSNFIYSHSIQNSKVLKKIADNGHLYSPQPRSDLQIPIMYDWGRSKASVFTGFCGYHDKTLFQPIEDQDFTGTKEQVFLYTYRAFAL